MILNNFMNMLNKIKEEERILFNRFIIDIIDNNFVIRVVDGIISLDAQKTISKIIQFYFKNDNVCEINHNEIIIKGLK